MPDSDRIDHLIARVDGLSSEVVKLRQRVDDLEHGAASAASPILLNPPTVPRQQNSSPAPDSGAGLKLLNRAGALTLFIGIIFFFKYAVDNAWIGAAGRVGLGVLTGVVLISAGDFLRSRGQTVFAQGLSACGVATLYISTYAASEYYELIGKTFSFVLFLLISGASLVLSIKSADSVLALVAYLGAISAPGLFRLLPPDIWTWFGFLYLFSIQLSIFVQSRLQSTRLLIPVTAAAIAAQAFWVVNPHHPIVCVLFLLALAALHFRPPKRAAAVSMIASQAYVIGHVLVLIAAFRFLVFWFDTVGSAESRRSLLSETGSIFLCLYGVALLASAVLRKSAADRIIGLTLLAIVVGKLYVFDVWLLTRFYRISAFVALGLLLLAGSFVYSRWKQRSSDAS